MKLLEHFKTFLDEQVNLNQTRINQLNISVEAVKKAIRESGWEPNIIKFTEQGSWAHGTIIKPQTDKEYDADIIAIVKPVEDWEAKDYINKLYSALSSNATYTDKLRRYDHCITIEYSGDKRIDIAPVVRGREYAGRDEVCNRTTNEFEISAPEAYTQWVKDKNSIAGGNDLKKVTRLLKYMRDIKGNFTCPSFLFTTLLGYRISNSDASTSVFCDTPTTLKTLIGRLDDWLQARPQLPDVRNPVLNTEIQSTAWDDTKYSNFRDKINLYRGWIDDAFQEQDRNESIAKWRRVFGDKFAEGEAKSSARISESILAKSTNSLALAGQCVDLVDLVKREGLRAIPNELNRLPYISRSHWRAAQETLSVNVTGHLTGNNFRSVRSGEPLSAGQSIKFTATTRMGTPFPDSDYRIKWRITNTDRAAFEAKSLRGDFYSSDKNTPMSRIEGLQYRGVHFVEAFLIKKSNNRLVGQSDPFYVVIE